MAYDAGVLPVQGLVWRRPAFGQAKQAPSSTSGSVAAGNRMAAVSSSSGMNGGGVISSGMNGGGVISSGLNGGGIQTEGMNGGGRN